ncbi:MAG TPA: PilX N-terminal domain-containing pilus assembly protein [Marinagarivorans sp.]
MNSFAPQNLHNKITCSSVVHQGGAALIVSLVLLSVISVMAIASSSRVSVEMKVVGSLKERGVAFQAAEAALAKVEQQLASAPPPIEMLWSTCAGEGCYASTCDGGRCFAGTYLPSDSRFNCSTQPVSPVVEPLPVWRDAVLNVWKNPSRHRTIDVDSVNASVKYIVEFMCYVRKDALTNFDGEVENANNGVPLFRITALAESDGSRAAVALQSTYKLLTNQ